MAKLTAIEIQIVQLALHSSLSNLGIGNRLGRTEGAIEQQMHSIYRKLGIAGRGPKRAKLKEWARTNLKQREDSVDGNETTGIERPEQLPEPGAS